MFSLSEDLKSQLTNAKAGDARSDAFEIKMKFQAASSPFEILMDSGIKFFESPREECCDQKNGEMIAIVCAEQFERIAGLPELIDIRVLGEGYRLVEEYNRDRQRLLFNIRKDEKNRSAPSGPLVSYKFPDLDHAKQIIKTSLAKPFTSFRPD